MKYLLLLALLSIPSICLAQDGLYELERDQNIRYNKTVTTLNQKMNRRPTDVIPAKDSTFDLGASGKEWNTIYVDHIISSAFPVGMVIAYISTTAPSGWLNVDGSTISRVTYPLLYAACGSACGPGNGSTTFTLPSAPGRTIVGAGQGVGLTDRTIASVFGAETHQLSTAELATHSHGSGTLAASGGNHDHTYSYPTTSQVLAALYAYDIRPITGSTTNTTGGTGAHSHTISGDTGNAGSGTAHNNMQPSLALNYIIYAGN